MSEEFLSNHFHKKFADDREQGDGTVIPRFRSGKLLVHWNYPRLFPQRWPRAFPHTSKEEGGEGASKLSSTFAEDVILTPCRSLLTWS